MIPCTPLTLILAFIIHYALLIYSLFIIRLLFITHCPQPPQRHRCPHLELTPSLRENNYRYAGDPTSESIVCPAGSC